VLVRGDSQLSLAGSVARRFAKYPIYRCFIPRFDGYLVVGERARQYYLRYGANPRRMFAAPHAVDNAFFEKESARERTARTQLRHSLGLPESAVVWLFAGKLVDRKRPGDFMQAISTAARADSRVWGLVVGDGPIRAELQRAARQEGWPVRFAGFLNQTQMPAGYAASDALVLTSDGSETWGLVVNEAMASGLPAVVSDEVGSAPDLVHQGQTGEVFRCGDVDQLASIVARLSADPSHLEQMGRRAQRHVDNYSIARAAAGTAAAIDAIARTRGRGAVK
jgi:glycosyltransferase involved in cell wall biosynthesis